MHYTIYDYTIFVGVSANSTLEEVLTNSRGPKLMTLFREKTKTEKKKRQELQKLMVDFTEQGGGDQRMCVTLIKLLMVYFGEKEEDIFMMADVSTCTPL